LVIRHRACGGTSYPMGCLPTWAALPRAPTPNLRRHHRQQPFSVKSFGPATCNRNPRTVHRLHPPPKYRRWNRTVGRPVTVSITRANGSSRVHQKQRGNNSAAYPPQRYLMEVIARAPRHLSKHLTRLRRPLSPVRLKTVMQPRKSAAAAPRCLSSLETGSKPPAHDP